MAHVVVIGAGISGVACARVLVDAGHRVEVLDQGWRPGGRMALKRHGERPADIGASYFTVSDPGFEAVVTDWERRGLARPWTDTFATWSPSGAGTTTGPMRWAAPAGLRRLVDDLAGGLSVAGSTEVQSVRIDDDGPRVDGRPYDAVVLALPDPTARRLLGPELAELSARLDDPYEPVLALLTRFSERCWADLDGMFVNEHPVISWIADDGRRRGDDAPVLVAHATPEFAEPLLATPADGAERMVAAVREVLDLTDEPAESLVHRWTFARPAQTRDESFALDPRGVGACGDSWSPRPSVQAAWLSGRRLGKELAASLGGR